MISQESLDKFKEIYKQVFKEDIPDAEALEMATRLLDLCQVVCFSSEKEIIPQNEKKEIQNNNQTNYESR